MRRIMSYLLVLEISLRYKLKCHIRYKKEVCTQKRNIEKLASSTSEHFRESNKDNWVSQTHMTCLQCTDTAKLSLYQQLWLVSLLARRVTHQCSVRSLPTNEITTIRSSIGRIAHYSWNCKNTVISHTHYNSFHSRYLQYFFSTVLYVSIEFPSDCFQKNCRRFSCNSKILKGPSHHIYLTEPHFRHWRQKLLYIAGIQL